MTTQPGLIGRTALVTGAASGIGLAISKMLAGAGATVHLVDKNGPAVHTAAEDYGGVAHEIDLSDPAAIDTLPSTVDILVNNAGMQHVAGISEFPPEMFRLMQDVMVTAPFLILRRVLPHMYARRWGRVVNISSVHGLRASPFKSAYVAAKHALEGLSKVVALEGAPYGVTSNCINPAYVRTPLVEKQVTDLSRAHRISEKEVLTDILLDRTAVKRLLEPVQVAEAVLWLCQQHSGHLTGISIPIDGGWTAR
ncbi:MULTISPECIES: 3-hydroxybutyrate dehydrogenase [unclassified Crossiella]|uniref:3-hydroxybutyrate dehydrogenase n=1 Tax=unclassified Crossiella TaxID=2620835 RepID=UPI001FFF0B30|nr:MULTISPECIES: 3-hydroxybutyrate dehydrogenase [unclassified Crossiella]MCK2243632.1 3-hydroxybutyrate dehydrogenase [Crossiella sp. S99.2]MCK2257490.1 3-hydroxybutyrate dehydrogenase [Crossiella sp. S99.1]